MTKTIKQTVRFNTTPERVFNALMDSAQHSEFTQNAAEIENFEGGKFSAYGGGVEGETILLNPNRRIVQKWRSMNWQKGVYSELTYQLEKDGDQTIVSLIQTGVPDNEYEKINEGWEMMYWVPMKKYFEKHG